MNAEIEAKNRKQIDHAANRMMAREVETLRAELEQARAELGISNSRLNQVRARVQNLTPGGSEFIEIGNCLSWIEDRLHSFGKVAAERNQARSRISELTTQVNDACKQRDDVTLTLSGVERAAQAVQDGLDAANGRIVELEGAAFSVVALYKTTCYDWKKHMDMRIERLSSLLPEPPQ